jgi:hypothetical protein
MEDQNTTILNGVDIETEIPVYLSQDANKSLRINNVATGLEWVPVGPNIPNLVSNALLSNNGISLNWTTGLQYNGTTLQNDGNFIAKTGTSSSDGYQFANITDSGVFGIQLGKQVVLRSNLVNRVIANDTDVQINGNLNLSNDLLLNNNESIFIGSNEISGATNIINIRPGGSGAISATNVFADQVKFTKSINFSDHGFSSGQPHIFSGNYGGSCSGINFSQSPSSVTLVGSAQNILTADNDYVTCNRVLRINQNIVPSISIYTESASQYSHPVTTGNHIVYMKKGLTNDTVVSFANPTVNSFYKIIADGNAAGGTASCRVVTASADVIQINAGVRTVFTGPVNITLTINTAYDFTFITADNRWLMVRVT